jgi:hypothetical protein
VQASLQAAFASDGVKAVVADLVDAEVLDVFVERLLANPALWRLVDEIASSPAVTAAITQQGLGFVDQVGDQVRSRSRNADDRFEQAARRLIRRRGSPQPASDVLSPGTS